MKHLSLFMLLYLLSGAAYAQIGYQAVVLNPKTGNPRANETVNVTVTITNSADAVICTESKSAKTDETGALSITVGNTDTFANTDWNKQPFYISATIDGVPTGKTRMLSLPIAEFAKHSGTLSREHLNGKSFGSISFTKDVCKTSVGSGPYEVCDDTVTVYAGGKCYIIFYADNKMFFNGHIYSANE